MLDIIKVVLFASTGLERGGGGRFGEKGERGMGREGVGSGEGEGGGKEWKKVE